MAGDAQTPFSIQSISKVFTLTMALGRAGTDLWRRVGHEPSGSAFNSIVQLEREKGIPRNPLINAGALVVTDTLLAGDDVADTIARITDFMRRVADDPAVAVDPEVAASERATGYRNASLANFLRASDNLRAPAGGGARGLFQPVRADDELPPARPRRTVPRQRRCRSNHARARLSTPVRTRRVNAIMMTCGHYDASGDVAFRVGPARQERRRRRHPGHRARTCGDRRLVARSQSRGKFPRRPAGAAQAGFTDRVVGDPIDADIRRRVAGQELRRIHGGPERQTRPSSTRTDSISRSGRRSNIG